MAEVQQAETREEKGKFITVVIIVILALILGIVYWQEGQAGVSAVLGKFIKWALIAAVGGLIVYAVLRFLRKPKVDLVENDKQDIIAAALMSKSPLMQDLYLTGDKDHGEARLGTIIGYTQLQSYKDLDLIAGLSQSQIDELEKQGKLPSDFIIKEDVFIFKRWAFPLNIFEEPKVLRTLEHEHTQLIGNVKVRAVSVIRKYGFMYPNRAHLDIARIDIGVIREAWRGQIHQFLKDSVSIQQRAVGLDSEFKKELDYRKLLKIPSPMGEDASRRGER
jgi:hypothetical protein